MEPKKETAWSVTLSSAVEKQMRNLQTHIKAQLFFLIKEMESLGPHRVAWKNYGPLKRGRAIPDNAFHCHLKKGRPTYVACWTVNKNEKKIEVFYVGTHENAPY